MRRQHLTLLTGLALLAPLAAAHAQDRTEQRAAAARIRGDGQRAADRGDAQGARDARAAAREAGRAPTPQRAREIERGYNQGTPRPSTPGRRPSGATAAH